MVPGAAFILATLAAMRTRFTPGLTRCLDPTMSQETDQKAWSAQPTLFFLLLTMVCRYVMPGCDP
jgi:hypothetical protein